MIHVHVPEFASVKGDMQALWTLDFTDPDDLPDIEATDVLRRWCKREGVNCALYAFEWFTVEEPDVLLDLTRDQEISFRLQFL